ncbi:MAG: cyclodeaminase/cyclohydrolase family protein [Oscillospiraceae bacterium]|jgi:formiminotetrahydrofolate cyclodeaminase|nr:cyclodeaminase/cyclohydrolase family protein [Oscillospiraceae bacterium]
MKLVEKSSIEFAEVLASKAPVPGGGGASALVGAIGVALGNMVASLTLGKKKYADVEADILRLQAEATALQNKLLELVDKDAEDFEPLSKAYGIPKDDPNRAEIMESALKAACETPLEIMRCCATAIDVIEELAEKGSTLAISDAAVGAVFAGAALQGASYNVYINTKSLTDRAAADRLNAEADELNSIYVLKAEKISSAVYRKLKGAE